MSDVCGHRRLVKLAFVIGASGNTRGRLAEEPIYTESTSDFRRADASASGGSFRSGFVQSAGHHPQQQTPSQVSDEEEKKVVQVPSQVSDEEEKKQWLCKIKLHCPNTPACLLWIWCLSGWPTSPEGFQAQPPSCVRELCQILYHVISAYRPASKQEPVDFQERFDSLVERLEWVRSLTSQDMALIWLGMRGKHVKCIWTPGPPFPTLRPMIQWTQDARTKNKLAVMMNTSSHMSRMKMLSKPGGGGGVSGMGMWGGMGFPGINNPLVPMPESHPFTGMALQHTPSRAGTVLMQFSPGHSLEDSQSLEGSRHHVYTAVAGPSGPIPSSLDPLNPSGHLFPPSSSAASILAIQDKSAFDVEEEDQDEEEDLHQLLQELQTRIKKKDKSRKTGRPYKGRGIFQEVASENEKAVAVEQKAKTGFCPQPAKGTRKSATFVKKPPAEVAQSSKDVPYLATAQNAISVPDDEHSVDGDDDSPCTDSDASEPGDVSMRGDPVVSHGEGEADGALATIMKAAVLANQSGGLGSNVDLLGVDVSMASKKPKKTVTKKPKAVASKSSKKRVSLSIDDLEDVSMGSSEEEKEDDLLMTPIAKKKRKTG